MAQKVCSGCSKAIEDRYVEVGGQYLHGACFVCGTCNTSLEGKKAAKRNGKLICADCAGGEQCHRCQKRVGLGEKAIAVGGLHFHDPQCLTCAEPACRAPIPTNRLFLSHKGPKDIFCANHTYV